MSKSPDSSWTTAVPVSISLTRMHVRMLVFLSFEIACLPLSSFPTALISVVSVEIWLVYQAKFSGAPPRKYSLLIWSKIISPKDKILEGSRRFLIVCFKDTSRLWKKLRRSWIGYTMAASYGFICPTVQMEVSHGQSWIYSGHVPPINRFASTVTVYR